MHIVYFTTAQRDKDWNEFYPKWRISLNPSNQNFHNKLIRSLAINNDVDVISIRPFSHQNSSFKYLNKFTIKDNNHLSWHYIKRSGGKIYRNLSLFPEAKKVLSNLDLRNTIFITDTINPGVLKVAIKAKHKYNCPLIGVCTDSPSNISNTGRSYTLSLLKQASQIDGFISLTDELNQLFNVHNLPSFILEGLLEDEIKVTQTNSTRPYFFFGGSLMRKYGVYNLIEAFKQLDIKTMDLIICGHHENKEEIKEAIKGTTNIHYLKLLPIHKVHEYENDAVACVNPRPYNEDLDRFSIPSKTIEYLYSNSLTISLKNTKLMHRFNDAAIWVNSNEISDLKTALLEAANMDVNKRKKMIANANAIAKDLYSLSSVAKQIQSFLANFIR